MAIFGPKQWVNPIGKMWIFRLFELLVTSIGRRVTNVPSPQVNSFRTENTLLQNDENNSFS